MDSSGRAATGKLPEANFSGDSSVRSRVVSHGTVYMDIMSICFLRHPFVDMVSS